MGTAVMRKNNSERRGSLPAYVLITPARNEAAFIEKTIESVIQQTVLPTKWVIVDDGSTDNTAAIVSRYLWTKSLDRTRSAARAAGPELCRQSACLQCRL